MFKEVWSGPCSARRLKVLRRRAPGYTDVLVLKEIDCGDWLAQEYMPAHQQCGLFYPLDWGLEGSPPSLIKVMPLVLQSWTVS